MRLTEINQPKRVLDDKKKDKEPIYYIRMDHNSPIRTYLQIWRSDDKIPIELRADQYKQWTHFEKTKTKAQELHDGLEGWHTSILHTGDTAAILPKHPDYEFVDSFWKREVEELNRLHGNNK